jgi:hypothetical protein
MHTQPYALPHQAPAADVAGGTAAQRAGTVRCLRPAPLERGVLRRPLDVAVPLHEAAQGQECISGHEPRTAAPRRALPPQTPSPGRPCRARRAPPPDPRHRPAAAPWRRRARPPRRRLGPRGPARPRARAPRHPRAPACRCPRAPRSGPRAAARPWARAPRGRAPCRALRGAQRTPRFGLPACLPARIGPSPQAPSAHPRRPCPCPCPCPARAAARRAPCPAGPRSKASAAAASGRMQ